MDTTTDPLPTTPFPTATHLLASCEVRYWEDATVDGEEDTDGSRVPCREGDLWCPKIRLDTGVIENWRHGTTADVHYKICDAGEYALVAADGTVLFSYAGYVPDCLVPGGKGFGDYAIFHVTADGTIAGWRRNLGDFVRRAARAGHGMDA